ncbi:FliH/SctL family protein [Vogesella sp. LIG4]|uniref:FliH/SctL family protein n=1 Tax=Vogesella sp. LIG4 TaxID=1192162 RepID=UPI00081FD71C|nr:FliH/SctL family protein [Vogesella sp. LIG4]SCK20967.1 flagellar assembly protein FliH [Vogesella sp. LIG4]
MSNNNVIPAESLGQWKSWQFGELGEQPAAAQPQPESDPETSEPPAQGVSALEPAEGEAAPAEEAELEEAPLAYPTAAELEAIHQEAWQAGFDAGQQEGLQQGRAVGETSAQNEANARFAEHWQPLAAMQQSFEQQLQLLGEELSADVLVLAVELAERIVATRIEVDPEQMLPLLQQALEEIGQGLQQARIRANPADIEVIEAFAANAYPGVSWQWLPDEAVERGGCVIDTPQRKIDLGLPQRLQLLRRALGVQDE